MSELISEAEELFQDKKMLFDFDKDRRESSVFEFEKSTEVDVIELAERVL